MGVLTVVLVKIANLRDEDGLGKSDPYVKFELEKDKWMFDKTLGKFESTHKKNDCNPEYNETFKFEKVPTMDNMKLHVKGEQSRCCIIEKPFVASLTGTSLCFQLSRSHGRRLWIG
jgi:Ca2+-dependent lipid-binding protein